MVWLPTGVEFEAVAVAIAGCDELTARALRAACGIIESIDRVGEGCNFCIQLGKRGALSLQESAAASARPAPARAGW